MMMKKFLNKDLNLMLFAAVLGVLFFIFSQCSKAEASDFSIESLTVGYAPVCWHWKGKDYYNEDDNHAILVAATLKNGWKPFLLTFRNSYHDRAIAAGIVFRTKKWKPFNNELFFRGNFLVGVINGYGDRFTLNVGGDDWGIAPIAAPTGEAGYKNVSLHFLATPAVASVMLTYRFDFLGR